LKGAKVWAFDYAKNMVAATERRLAIASLKAEKLTIDSVFDIPYPVEMFDAVLRLDVVDHIPDEERPKAAAELTRVIKPGGCLYINTPNRFVYHWSDLRRHTIFSDWLISILDSLYILLETRFRRIEPLKAVCLHYFLEARKPFAKKAQF